LRVRHRRAVGRRQGAADRAAGCGPGDCGVPDRCRVRIQATKGGAAVDRSGDELARPADADRARLRPGAFVLASAALALVGVLFVGLPLAAVFAKGDLVAGARSHVARDALLISLQTSLLSLAAMVLVGTPIAYLLATRTFPGRSIVITLFELPLVLPPAVAGLGLFFAFGRRGLLGSELSALG